MEEMALEFGDMLKETLEKMSQRIEIAHTSMDIEQAASVQRKLQEYNLNS